jgi:hypothetical protein
MKWPADLDPSVADVHAVNELVADVPPEAIWPWLVRATRWRELYSNAWRVRIENGAADLSLGARFSWWTFGVPVRTTVLELVPARRLAWRGEGLGAMGYHAFDLEPTARGTRLLTEETQRGAAVRVLRPMIARGLHHFHQRWLEGLARAAALGHPDAVRCRSRRLRAGASST